MADTISLPENLTIHGIDQAYSDLSNTFQDAGDEIILDGNSVETIDTSGLQAILVLVQYAKEHNKTLQWQSASETLKNSAGKVGLLDALKLT